MKSIVFASLLLLLASVLAQGQQYSESAKFTISEDTVKRHLSNIYNKLGVSNRLELTLYAMANKLGISE